MITINSVEEGGHFPISGLGQRVYFVTKIHTKSSGQNKHLCLFLINLK